MPVHRTGDRHPPSKAATAALAGVLIGIVAGGAFYLLAPWLRWGAMFPAWILLWLLFAALQRQLARGETVATTAKRGVLAALLSGVAFYLISDIWIHEAAHPSMLVHYAAWAFAFAPGFAALFARTRDRNRLRHIGPRGLRPEEALFEETEGHGKTFTSPRCRRHQSDAVSPLREQSVRHDIR